MIRSVRVRPSARRLLVLDASYSLEAIRAKRQEASVTCRDLGGYFDEVWTVHPFATLVTSAGWAPRCGRPVTTRLAPRHIFIEGKVGRFGALGLVPPINFCLAQADILIRLLQLVRRNRISAVRAGDPLLMGLYGWIISRLCGIPLLVRLAANYEQLRQQTGKPVMRRFLRFVRVERALERFVLSRADMVAAVNDDYLQYAVSLGVSPARATVFRYGNLVSPVHFVPPAQRRVPTDLLTPLGLAGRRFLLCVGRLEAVKMPDHAIRALAIVRQRAHDVALLMVGDGSMLSQSQSLAHQLGVEKHVVFAGERDQEWLAAVIPHASAALSPLTGRALCEVALGAAPTIAYDMDWQGELIRPGVTGELIEKGDVQGMAGAAIRLLETPAYASRLGAELRTLALSIMDPAVLDAHERRQYELLLEHFHAVDDSSNALSMQRTKR